MLLGNNQHVGQVKVRQTTSSYTYNHTLEIVIF